MKLSILIPVLNYEDVLEENISEVRKVVPDAEILLIYDITKKEFEKKAFDLVRRLKKKYKVRTVFRMNKKGFGSALKLGFEEARGDYVLITMGDLCDDPHTIPKMIKKLDEGYGVVSGCRYMEGGGIVGDTPKQRISSFVSLLINIFSTVKIRDVTNAFKMYRKGVLKSISPELKSESFDISAEMTLLAAKHGFTLGQVPTIWKNRCVGQSNFKMFKEAKKYFKMFIFSAFYMPSVLTKTLIALFILSIVFILITILL